MIKGIDVSSVQGVNINWQAVANTGTQFVIVKCGNGNDPSDPDYAKNVAGAKAVGLQVLAYHFVYPLPVFPGHENRSPQAQAQAHFNAAQGVTACCDLEWPVIADWSRWGCSATQIRQWALDYLVAYSALSGNPMIIYTYPDFARTINIAASPEFAQYPLWIASYEPQPAIPAPWTDWVLWQNTGGGGHLPNGAPIDTDVAKDLSLWGVFNEPAEAPIQEPKDPVPTSNSASSGDLWTSNGNDISQLFKKK